MILLRMTARSIAVMLLIFAAGCAVAELFILFSLDSIPQTVFGKPLMRVSVAIAVAMLGAGRLGWMLLRWANRMG